MTSGGSLVLAQRRRRRGRHQPRDRAEPALAWRASAATTPSLAMTASSSSLVQDADDVFAVVAKDGVEHGCTLLQHDE